MIYYLKDLIQLQIARLIKNRYSDQNPTFLESDLDKFETLYELICGLQD